jgi:hypothetical protein
MKMNKTKLTILFLLILLQTSGTLISAIAISSSNNSTLSSVFTESKVEVTNLSAIFVVVKSSFQEQIKAITNFATLPLGFSKTNTKTDSNNTSNSSNSGNSHAVFFNIVNSNSNYLNYFTAVKQPVSFIFESSLNTTLLFTAWILSFLILFKLRKPKNYFFILARTSIDYIAGGKVYRNPIAY